MQTEKTRHLRTRVISVLLAVLMIVTCLPSMLFPVSADNNGRSGGPLVLTNASVEFRDSKYNPIDEYGRCVLSNVDDLRKQRQ